jgi:hypothetical protein
MDSAAAAEQRAACKELSLLIYVRSEQGAGKLTVRL